MKEKKRTEEEFWEEVNKLLNEQEKKLGASYSSSLFHNPQKLANTLSLYKFIAKIACPQKKVLELCCGEGIGSPILSEESAEYLGIDEKKSSIKSAQDNWSSEKRSFVLGDFLKKPFGKFDTIISLNTEKALKKSLPLQLFQSIHSHLSENGICIFKITNNKKHIKKIQEDLLTLFHNVFTFFIDGGTVHSEISPLADNLLFLGCYKRGGKNEKGH